MGEGYVPETRPSCVFAYRGNDPVGAGQGLFIAETENGPAEAFQFQLSEMVPQNDVIPLVNAAVDLEDQPEPVAGEVGEVPADGVLAAEAVSVDPSAAKPLPQAALGQTGGLTLIARESCSLASHYTIITCLFQRVSPLSHWERA